MDTQKILVAGLIGGVFSFFFGWLVFGILFTDLMQYPVEGLMKAEEDIIFWSLIVSNIVWGMLLAYVFVKSNVKTWMDGAKMGGMLGFLIVTAFDTGFYAMTNMFTISSMVMDIVINIVFTAIMGAVVGWWLGRK